MLYDNVLSSSEHYHATDPDKNEAVEAVLLGIRKRASEGVEKPRQIIQQARTAITLEVAPHIPAYISSQRTIERQRKCKQLPYPNSQNVVEITIPDTLKTSTRGENFVLWDSGPNNADTILMFGTMDNSNHLQLLNSFPLLNLVSSFKLKILF